jgi:protease YdgD
MSLRGIGLFLLCLITTIANASPNVFGEDGRKTVTSQNLPWSAVGRLETSTSFCTATLIAKDLILTAAHCFYKDNVYVKHAYKFVPNYGVQMGTSSLISKIYVRTNSPSTSRTRDWAIAKLSKPLGKDFGFLAVKKMSAQDLLEKLDYATAHYSSNYMDGQKAAYQFGCHFTKDDVLNGFALHNCDNGRGSSGSSIFYFPNRSKDPSTAKIVAVHVGEYRGGSSQSLVGIEYSDAVANIALPSNRFFNTYYELNADQ